MTIPPHREVVILTRRDMDNKSYVAQTVVGARVYTTTRKTRNGAVRAVVRLAYPPPVR